MFGEGMSYKRLHTKIWNWLAGWSACLSLVACTQPQAGAECAAIYSPDIRGRIVNEDGSALAEAGVQPCVVRSDEAWLCLAPTRTDTDGQFTRTLENENACLQRLALRISGPNDGTTRGVVYCAPELSASSTVVLAGEIQVPVLSPTSSVDARIATFASGLALEVGEEDGEPADFTSAQVAPADTCFANAPEYLATFAFAPELRLRDSRLRRIPLPGVADGTRVDVLLLGGLATRLPDDSLLDEGTLAPIGEGVVMGGMLETEIELVYASWIAVRLQ